jgi:AcrR family transcriptional regulator
MARNIDETKMERVKEAGVTLIVNKGYGGASVSAIARQANVAEGYLYRFYNGKQDFVADLLHTKVGFLIDKLDHLLNNGYSIREIITILIGEIFSMASERPEDIKFLYVLMHDYNFQISHEQRKKIKVICEKAIRKGLETDEIRESITLEDIYGMTVLYPIIFLNLRLKEFFGMSYWDHTDQARIVNFCVHALK